MTRSAQRRRCPITGTSVWEADEAERSSLQPLPLVLPEPFDLVAQRRVAIDSTISFDGRSYSVLFRHADQVVDVRGCAETVQLWAEGEVVASHPRHTRHTRSRLLLDPTHDDGPSTDRVLHHSQVLKISGQSYRLRDLERVAPGTNARP